MTAQMRTTHRRRRDIPWFSLAILLAFVIGTYLVLQAQQNCSEDNIAAQSIERSTSSIRDAFQGDLNEILDFDQEDNQCMYHNYKQNY